MYPFSRKFLKSCSKQNNKLVIILVIDLIAFYKGKQAFFLHGRKRNFRFGVILNDSVDMKIKGICGLNHRDHRKIVVVDGGVGFVGGLNVGDMYLGRDPRMGRWRDTHLRLEGPAVRELDRVFLELWGQCVGGKAGKTECGGPESPSPTPDGGENGGENGKKGPVEGVPVQIASSGPGPTFRAIADGYFQMIASACRRVWITTPYLVPGETLSNALSIAARSGVDVRVIIPSKADHTLVFWASQFNVDTLLRNGVRVFSYKGGFVHAKTMVADSEIASVGTANLDVRSLEINYEVQAFMRSKELAAQLESAFLDDQELCEEESLSGRRNKPLIRKVQAAVGRLWPALKGFSNFSSFITSPSVFRILNCSDSFMY